MNNMVAKFIYVSLKKQQLSCYDDQVLYKKYPVSTAKNGAGEEQGSQCTPRGWHQIHALIGREAAVNSVFVGRRWTGELYNPELMTQFPGRDWILTRIIQLDGLEVGRNKNGSVDSLARYIYIHGTPDNTDLSKPGSHGCIRMRNSDIIELVEWVSVGVGVCIV